MINKRSLWFLTLFSLILVLSVYYITMPSELLMDAQNKKKSNEKEVSTKIKKENAELVALRVEEEEKMLDKMTELKKILTDSKSTTEEKNKAFEELQRLSKNRSKEDEIEKEIEKEFNLKSFISINDNNITATIDSKKHDKSLANKIMRTIQKNFDIPMNISVKFQK